MSAIKADSELRKMFEETANLQSLGIVESAVVSQAISLKRIADAMDAKAITTRLDELERLAGELNRRTVGSMRIGSGQ